MPTPNTHGRARRGKITPTHKSWWNMIQRCFTPSASGYAHYKKKGITVCDRWREFTNFLEDMGERPEGTTIDRIDNDGNYKPGNCRWATRREQANNTSTNIFYEYKGEQITISELARRTGASKETLRSRLRRSKREWTAEDAIAAPNFSRQGHYDAKKHFYRGEEYSIAGLSRATGTPVQLLYDRLGRGKREWTVEEAVNTPIIPRKQRGRIKHIILPQ